MQNLTNENYQTIKDTINTYNMASKGFKAFIDEKIVHKQIEVFSQYQSLCQNNPEWLDNYIFVKDYEDTINFDLNSNFEITVGDSTNRCKVYSEPLHQDYLDAHKHIHAYRRILNAKLAKLNSKRFSLGKAIKTNYYKNLLDSVEIKNKLLTDWQEKEQRKNEYLNTKAESYQVKKTQLDQIETQYANEVVCSNLQTCGILACANENTTLTATFQANDSTYEIDNSAINNLCNQIRQKALSVESLKKFNPYDDEIKRF